MKVNKCYGVFGKVKNAFLALDGFSVFTMMIYITVDVRFGTSAPRLWAARLRSFPITSCL